jgi:hypothetical protein
LVLTQLCVGCDVVKDLGDGIGEKRVDMGAASRNHA